MMSQTIVMLDLTFWTTVHYGTHRRELVGLLGDQYYVCALACSTVATGDPQPHAKLPRYTYRIAELVGDPSSVSQQALVFGLASRGWAPEWGYI